MSSPLPRSPVVAASLAALMLLVSCPARAGDPAPARERERSGLSVTVRPGESWEAVRGRMFPVRSLKDANPGLDPDLLHPGEIVRAPYVRSDLLARERAAREDAGRRLAQARGRLAAVERERAALAARREDFARAGGAVRRMKGVLLGLIAFAAVLLGCLGMALKALRAAHRHVAEEVARRRAVESRHEDLRRSLGEIETGLQRRMMALLHLHGGKIITQKELDASVGSVIDLAGQLREKHGRA